MIEGLFKGSLHPTLIRMHWLLEQERAIAKLKQREPAITLGVSEAAISQGLERNRGTLARLRDVKFLQNVPDSAELGS